MAVAIIAAQWSDDDVDATGWTTPRMREFIIYGIVKCTKPFPLAIISLGDFRFWYQRILPVITACV